MFSIKNPDDHNTLNDITTLINTDRKFEEGNIDGNISIIDKDKIENYKNHLEKFSEEKYKFFRLFLWYFYSDQYHWKSLSHSIYHIEHLINLLDNYQIKQILQKQFQILSDYFIRFIKDLITLKIKPSIINDTSSEANQIEQHIQNLKSHLNNLEEIILTTKEHFHLCKTEINALETILQAIKNINFHSRTFDQQDEEKIRLLSFKQDLSEKSTKTDFIQMKIYIDTQIKKLIEINKQNAKELERIKLLKTSTCQAHHIQSILSANSPSPSTKPNRIYSHQSSRPYLTFELDQIRRYQRQALLKSPYGTIPLYRRQAWAAANLFPDHSLHFLRYKQNSLRMQIHNLLGYDPSDICNMNKKKKINRNSNIEIFNRNEDILIVGNNNKFYRGRVNSCEISPLKKPKEKQVKIKLNKDENNEINQIHFEQFDQTNKTMFDEHLFEYLDWQIQFNEQDLPDELCKELFQHWISIVCDDQPCSCHSESKSNLIDTQIDSPPSLDSVYDDRCMCSKCSCTCEKYTNDESICLCSKCSCQCLKDFQNEKNEETIEDISEMSQKNSENEISTPEESPMIPPDQKPIIEEIEENEVIISDCFLNQTDRWTQQFDLFPSIEKQKFCFSLTTSQSSQGNDMNTIFHSFDLDDPSEFRQQILNHNHQ